MAAIPGARSGAAMYVEHKNTIRDGRSTAYKLLTLLTLYRLLALPTLFILLKLDCKTFTTQTFTTPDVHHPRRSPPPV